MIKSLAAFAIFAVLGASVIALPEFAPKVEASEAVALAKADRLEVDPLLRIVSSKFGPTSLPRVCETAIRKQLSKLGL